MEGSVSCGRVWFSNRYLFEKKMWSYCIHEKSLHEGLLQTKKCMSAYDVGTFSFEMFFLMDGKKVVFFPNESEQNGKIQIVVCCDWKKVNKRKKRWKRDRKMGDRVV